MPTREDADAKPGDAEVGWARERLAPLRGLRVARDAPVDGHVVRIQADTVYDCDVAQRLLAPVSELSRAKWEHGWRVVSGADGRTRFELDVPLGG